VNKELLAERLRIERRAQPTPGRKPALWKGSVAIAAGLAVLAAGAGTAAWRMTNGPQRVQTAVVQTLSSPDAVAGEVLSGAGHVVARRQATVSSKITGRVLNAPVEAGTWVREGELLARLDDSNARATLAQAEAQLGVTEAAASVARVAAQQSRRAVDRSERLHASGYVSDQAVEDARAASESAAGRLSLAEREMVTAQAVVLSARRALDDTVIRAPFSGVLTVKAAQPGEVISPVSAGGGFTRTGIGTIVDMSSLEVEVDVAESHISRVSPGMRCRIHLDAYPSLALPGEVAAIIPTADRTKATFTVRVRILAPDAHVMPEMGAKVSFLAQDAAAISEPRQSLSIPSGAVVRDEGQAFAFVVDRGLARRRPVTLGRTEAGQQIVDGGLRAGDMVIVQAPPGLRDGAAVRPKM